MDNDVTVDVPCDCCTAAVWDIRIYTFRILIWHSFGRQDTVLISQILTTDSSFTILSSWFNPLASCWDCYKMVLKLLLYFPIIQCGTCWSASITRHTSIHYFVTDCKFGNLPCIGASRFPIIIYPSWVPVDLHLSGVATGDSDVPVFSTGRLGSVNVSHYETLCLLREWGEPNVGLMSARLMTLV